MTAIPDPLNAGNTLANRGFSPKVFLAFFFLSSLWLGGSLYFQARQATLQKQNWSVLSPAEPEARNFQEKQFLIFQGVKPVGSFSSLFCVGREWSWHGTLDLRIHFQAFQAPFHAEFSLIADTERRIQKILASFRLETTSFQPLPSTLSLSGLVSKNNIRVSMFNGTGSWEKDFPLKGEFFLFNPIFPFQENFNSMSGSGGGLPAQINRLIPTPSGRIPLKFVRTGETRAIDGAQGFAYRIEQRMEQRVENFETGPLLFYFSMDGELLGLEAEHGPENSVFIHQGGTPKESEGTFLDLSAMIPPELMKRFGKNLFKALGTQGSTP